MNDSTRTTARVAVLAAVVLWGLSFVATKIVLREISPIALITIRFFMGTLLLWAILFLRGGTQRIPWTEWRWLILMGFIGIFVHQMLQAHGLKLTSAVNTGWLIGLTPIWSAILAAIMLKERFGTQKILGLLLGFVGALLVISKGQISASTLALPSTKGDLLILLSTFNWSLYSVLGHPTLKRLGPLRATAGAMLAGWLMLLPFFVAGKAWRELAQLTSAGWLAIAFLGIGCSGLGYLFWYGGLERIDASAVASFLYVEPLVTFAAAVALLGEQFGPLTVIGGVILLTGVVLVQRDS
jgi:drug/metabolite transporter (DMT)-like permease